MFLHHSFYAFNLSSVLITIFLSFISCFLVVSFSRKSKSGQTNVRSLVLFSLLLGFTFTATHFLVVSSVGLPFSEEHKLRYFSLNYLLSSLGSFFALVAAKKDVKNGSQYIFASTAIGLFILGADYIGFYTLFHDFIELKPILVVLTCLLTLGMSFSLIRFLIQITKEEIESIYVKWKYIGCLMAGISLGIIPYVTMVSMLNFDTIYPQTDETMTFLLPYVLLILANVFLTLTPDLFGEVILQKNTESYKSLFNHNPDAVFLSDLKGNIIDVNHVATRLTDYSMDELKSMQIYNLISRTNSYAQMFFSDVLSGKVKVVETKIIKKDGSEAIVKITAVRSIANQHILGVYGIVQDITEQKKAEEKIKHMAYHDELTGLPNKRQIDNIIDQAIKEQQHFGLIYIDFDRFKRINDHYGHDYGDLALKTMTTRLQHTIPDKSVLARIGGDEFLAFIPAHFPLEETAQKIINSFNKSMIIHEHEFLITSSLGISSFPEHAKNAKDLFKFADLAMYEAKENGSNHYCFFKQELMKNSIHKLEMEYDLRQAVKEEELTVHFQPKFNSKSNHIIGSEALARWTHPKHGNVSPGEFIQIAEESQFIVDLERVIIKKVFDHTRSWIRKGMHVPRTSINLSAVQFYRGDLITFLQNTLNDYGLTGDYFEFELTESTILREKELVNKRFNALIKMGFELSIDDFGTGYSSLSYLHKLSINRLKIDKSFMDQYQENEEVIKAIVSLASQLNLSIIAEGVETEDQIHFLTNLNCFAIQGYYYSPPLPVVQYEEKLRQTI